MDTKTRAELVRALRFESKQSRVDMTARPPRNHVYDAESRRVQRGIMRDHGGAVWIESEPGMDGYESYWAIRNSRYNARGRARARRPAAAVMSFQANRNSWDK